MYVVLCVVGLELYGFCGMGEFGLNEDCGICVCCCGGSCRLVSCGMGFGWKKEWSSGFLETALYALPISLCCSSLSSVSVMISSMFFACRE